MSDTRTKCPDCPDGQLWDRKGPTADACPTCGGTAFIWTAPEEETDYCECGAVHTGLEDAGRCEACGRAI